MAYIEMSYKSDALTRKVQIQVMLPSHEGWQTACIHVKHYIYYMDLVEMGQN